VNPVAENMALRRSTPDRDKFLIFVSGTHASGSTVVLTESLITLEKRGVDVCFLTAFFNEEDLVS